MTRGGGKWPRLMHSCGRVKPRRRERLAAGERSGHSASVFVDSNAETRYTRLRAPGVSFGDLATRRRVPGAFRRAVGFRYVLLLLAPVATSGVFVVTLS